MLLGLVLLGVARAVTVETRRVVHDGQSYTSRIMPAYLSAGGPPLLLVPPVGVGIDNLFYRRFQSAWYDRGGGATHAPDLLGTGSASPKPRCAYAPEVWGAQLDAYARGVVGEPCVLVVQGGLLAAALEAWRLGGPETIAGVSLLSPPPLSLVTDDAEEAFARRAATAPPGPPTRRAPRRISRLAWAAAASPLGNLFFRRLRGRRGARIADFTRENLCGIPPLVLGYPRILQKSLPPSNRTRFPRFLDRSYSLPELSTTRERAPKNSFRNTQVEGILNRLGFHTGENLFADPAAVDREWVDQCVASAADARSRFATLAYLCGTIPAGGTWRDDRGGVLDALTVPTQIVRGDFPGASDPVARTENALRRLPNPACSFVVPRARACLPYEQPEKTAAAVRAFVAELPGADPRVTTL